MSDQENDLLRLMQQDDNAENMYLTFDVAGEEYAVNISYVTEVVGMQKISEVPDVPAFVKGVINLRGKVIPVLDMRLRFNLPGREYTERTTIVVLELQGVPTGLVVDQVTDVLTIAAENVSPPPRWQGRGESVVSGLGRREGGVSILLDVPRLLSEKDLREDLAGLSQVAAEAAVGMKGEGKRDKGQTPAAGG